MSGQKTCGQQRRAVAEHTQIEMKSFQLQPRGCAISVRGCRRAPTSLSSRVRCAAASEVLPSSSTQAMIALSPEELCARAREFVDTGSGYFTPSRPELMSDEFVFRGPVIGPLCKKDYIATLGGFKLYESFPDLQSNSYGYCVDPSEPMRIRFFVRQTGTCLGPVNLFAPVTVLPPTNKKSVVATEAYSILFDEQGKVKLLNVGYCVDFDAPGVNGGKLGAALGLLAGAGIEVPLGKVFTSVQWLTTQLQDSGLLQTRAARAISKWEDIPQWYKEYCPKRLGAEGAPGH